MKKLRLSYEDGLAALFLTGIAAGTFLVNWMSGESRAGLGAFPFLAGEGGAGGSLSFFSYLLRRRWAVLAAGWLAGLTPFGKGCFLAAAGYVGLSLSVSLSVFTYQAGLMGPLWFLAALLPHFPFYAVCWSVLAVWAGKEEKRPRFLPFLCLLALAAVGAAGECWGAPAVAGWLG